jgi:hypothetical protein
MMRGSGSPFVKISQLTTRPMGLGERKTYTDGRMCKERQFFLFRYYFFVFIP